MNIGVVGLGKLGLCFALGIEKSGHCVFGVDISLECCTDINTKKLNSFEPQVKEYLLLSENFEARTDLSWAVDNCKIIFCVVATPSLKSGKYDHSQVDDVVNKLIQYGKQKESRHLIINCTTMPGYCDSVFEQLRDYNWSVSYNPEFIAQGTVIKNQENPDMVLIGESSVEVGDEIQKIYEDMIKCQANFHRMTRLEAEICKISLNCFLTTKISFANAIGDIVVESGGNPQKVLDAIASDSRVGKKLMSYGFGYGGPCLPRDNRALGVFSSELGLSCLIGVATDQANVSHRKFQVDKFKDRGYLCNSATYKPESVLIEESQQLAFAYDLAHKKIPVRIKERPIVVEQIKEKYGDLFEYDE